MSEARSDPRGLAMPEMAAIAVHWNTEEELAALAAAWPADPRFALTVVNNGSRRPLTAGRARILEPGRNLGFAGGVNYALARTRSPLVLLLNPDARPEPGALESLLDGFARHPDAAGLAPRLLGPDGASQHRWQLRPLPGAATLLLQTLLLPAGRGPRAEPAAGAVVEQPAAAALALRRAALEGLGGLDESFFPAWFEDVDLGRRLRDRGLPVRYWPAARFRHQLGASLRRLGYGPFLWVYYHNLERYLGKHHPAVPVLLARAVLAAGLAARLAMLPARRPRRAASRRQAAAGLAAAALGALSGWRLPRVCRAMTSRAPGAAAGAEAEP